MFLLSFFFFIGTGAHRDQHVLTPTFPTRPSSDLVALNYVFDTPDDKLIGDVGHQAYPENILTGRRDRIRTLRQGGGLSGFTRRAESDYDPFGAAHSST